MLEREIDRVLARLDFDSEDPFFPSDSRIAIFIERNVLEILMRPLIEWILECLDYDYRLGDRERKEHYKDCRRRRRKTFEDIERRNGDGLPIHTGHPIWEMEVEEAVMRMWEEELFLRKNVFDRFLVYAHIFLRIGGKEVKRPHVFRYRDPDSRRALSKSISNQSDLLEILTFLMNELSIEDRKEATAGAIKQRINRLRRDGIPPWWMEKIGWYVSPTSFHRVRLFQGIEFFKESLCGIKCDLESIKSHFEYDWSVASTRRSLKDVERRMLRTRKRLESLVDFHLLQVCATMDPNSLNAEVNFVKEAFSTTRVASRC